MCFFSVGELSFQRLRRLSLRYLPSERGHRCLVWQVRWMVSGMLSGNTHTSLPQFPSIHLSFLSFSYSLQLRRDNSFPPFFILLDIVGCVLPFLVTKKNTKR